MRKFFRLFFNYYLVLKSIWFVMLFLFIGFFALVGFDQGQDILKTLSFTTDPELIRHTWFVYFAVAWWAWQSFRASRVILHFTYFNFWSYKPSYALRAQVFIPRLVASLPFFLLAYAVYHSTKTFDTFVFLLISSGIWLFVFLHFRKRLIVWMRSFRPFKPGLIPDYIPIKNGTYPAYFIWSKQRRWFIFRILVVAGLFLLIYRYPVQFPQYVGSAAIVLLGFGSWLILATIVSFIEKYLRFPVTFSILMLVVVFSFFNNNHAIRTLDSAYQPRPSIKTHFSNWVKDRKHDKDSLDVYLVMAEGGGLRSAYWTSRVLERIQQQDERFADHIYAFSAVSGGTIGTLTFHGLQQNGHRIPTEQDGYLKSDLLAPVTSALIFTDLLQKFIPFPVRQLDRARVLEKSFEQSLPAEDLWKQGFLAKYSKTSEPVILLNTTHVESGKRAVISNVDLNPLEDFQVIDFFDVQPKDIRISTATGISSRFPFITPPALIKPDDHNQWGNLVDGGYYENLGMQTMLDLYTVIQPLALEMDIPIRFKFIAIRNTKALKSEKAVKGMTESLAPALTFSHIWSNNSNEVLQYGEQVIQANGDELHQFALQREDHENIPLGWYLSRDARRHIEKQVASLSFNKLK